MSKRARDLSKTGSTPEATRARDEAPDSSPDSLFEFFEEKKEVPRAKMAGKPIVVKRSANTSSTASTSAPKAKKVAKPTRLELKIFGSGSKDKKSNLPKSVWRKIKDTLNMIYFDKPELGLAKMVTKAAYNTKDMNYGVLVVHSQGDLDKLCEILASANIDANFILDPPEQVDAPGTTIKWRLAGNLSSSDDTIIKRIIERNAVKGKFTSKNVFKTGTAKDIRAFTIWPDDAMLHDLRARKEKIFKYGLDITGYVIVEDGVEDPDDNMQTE